MEQAVIIIERRFGFERIFEVIKAKRYITILVRSSFKYPLIEDEFKKFIDIEVEVNNMNIETICSKLDLLKKSYEYKGIISFLEYCTVVTSELAKRYGLVSNSIVSSLKCRSKAEMRTRFKELNVPSTKFQLIDKQEDELALDIQLDYPCILKPTNLGGSSCVFEVNSDEEIPDYLREIFTLIVPYSGVVVDQAIIEEKMIGKEYSVEAIVHEKIDILMVTEKFFLEGSFIEIGHIMPAEIDEKKEVEIKEVAKKAITAMGIENSLVHCEIMDTSQGPKVIEIASRIGGDQFHRLIGLVTGVDVLDITVSMLVGEKINLATNRLGYAGIEFIIAEPGEIISFEGIEEVTKYEFVIKVQMEWQIGEVINSLKSNSSRVGYVICVGENRKQVLERLSFCKKSISVITSRRK